MRQMLKTAIIGTLAIVLLGIVFVPGATAQCAFPGWNKAGAIEPRTRGAGELRPGSFLLAATQGSSGGGIVGFWKVKFVSEGNPGIPDGTVLDNGFAQWHDDGTEIMNSSRVPATGSFCLGVWQKSGSSSYDLNHFALSYDPAGNFVGPARIQEHVTVDGKADQYEGTFSIDQYDPSGNLLVHIEGQVTARRVDVNTPIGDVL